MCGPDILHAVDKERDHPKRVPPVLPAQTIRFREQYGRYVGYLFTSPSRSQDENRRRSSGGSHRKNARRTSRDIKGRTRTRNPRRRSRRSRRSGGKLRENKWRRHSTRKELDAVARSHASAIHYMRGASMSRKKERMLNARRTRRGSGTKATPQRRHSTRGALTHPTP